MYKSNSHEKPPKRIWLQWFDEDGHKQDGEEMTWCEDQIFDTDVEYQLVEK
jgi:hypothetical protein